MPTPIEVKALDNYKLWVKYSDGIEGVVDLSDFAGDGVFALWNDYREFQKVHIGPSGEIAWSDQVDMCPDAIYLRIAGKKPEDIFPIGCRLPISCNVKSLEKRGTSADVANRQNDGLIDEGRRDGADNHRRYTVGGRG